MNFYSFIVEFLFSISFDFNSCSNLVYFVLIQVNFDVKFQEKIKKNVEKPWKARQGSKAKGTEHCISRCKNFARWNPTCENAFQGANFQKHIFIPLFKVRKFLHRAKHPPGTRVAFRTAQANFRTVRIKVRKFRTPQSKVRNSFQHAKITVQGDNYLNVSFTHHYSRCENFRTVRNKVQKFRTVRNWVRNSIQGAKFSV